MKSIVLAAAIFLAAAPATTTLTQGERDKAVAELEGSKKMFLDATKGLSAAQWNFKPSPERWSVAECARRCVADACFRSHSWRSATIGSTNVARWAGM